MAEREIALAVNPEFLEKLHWGAKVVGVRVSLPRQGGSRSSGFNMIADSEEMR